MSPYTTLHACTTFCTDIEGIKVERDAMPFLKQWMDENGYVHRDWMLRDQLAKIPAPVVVVLGDCE